MMGLYMWAYESVFYQIYPLGLCGAPFTNDGVTVSRIRKILDWIPHMQNLGITALYLCPVFESDTHGYDTRDYTKVDCRLGTNQDLADVVHACHDAGIRVVLDGVFNHVGRGFPPFQDVLRNRECSPYVHWFSQIDFSGNSPYDDDLWYEGWEGNYDLVKLDLRNEDVIDHILWTVGEWISQFDIDGIRLDVAYCLDRDFLGRLRSFCDSRKQDFFLVGEVLHGEYGRMLNEMHIHSLTNYQCYKGLHSSFNSSNMFEIVHSLSRLFGPEDWTVCRDAHLLSFCDNHDVSRIASVIQNPAHLPLVYALLFGMPGIPCVYYGSEWGVQGDKSWGDPALRPCFDRPEWTSLTDYIAQLAHVRRDTPALTWGGFKVHAITSKACIFERRTDNECVLVSVNMDENEVEVHPMLGWCRGINLLTGEEREFSGHMTLPGYSAGYWKVY